MNNDERSAARVWVVLPTFNEIENLGQMLRAINALDPGLHILVVDDASPDGTGEMAEQMARESARIQVVRRVRERGLGTAYRAGFQHALGSGADAVITMDCDFSHDPRAIPTLLEASRTAHVVIGSRYVAGGRIEKWTLHRRLLSASANRFARALFDIPARDCTSGFRLYQREVLEAIPWNRVRSTGYAFLVETLYWASRQKSARIREVPIRFVDRERGQGKMGARETFYGVTNLLRLRADLSRLPDS
jgi:dolichol-phosphate mannosyltransferase